jgi:4-diphosphocytidyl-2-C-methyl-D-erythritol kinase
MTALRSFAPAKINLYLHVTGKRADGYHLLDSLIVFAGAGDYIEAQAAGELSLTISGAMGHTLEADDDNLVLKAARALAAAGNVPPYAAINLEKNLPVASGIGGGSADAAATLRVLAKLWNLKIPLEPIALSLGADVPVCLARKTRRMTGIGEILTNGPAMPDLGLVLINPGVPVPTKEIFAARKGPFSPAVIPPVAWRETKFLAADIADHKNDLQAPAIARVPEIAAVLETLHDDKKCLLARMSGSGATCFGIYENPAAAAMAAHTIRRAHWWVWGGGLAEILLHDL